MSQKELRDIRGSKIAMIYQEPMASLNPAMKIGKQLMEVPIIHEQASQDEAYKRSLDMLSSVKLPDPARVMDATLALLNADHRTFGAVMAEMGDEVLFHVATNPAFRSSIQQRARADTGFSPQAMRREAARPRQARFRAEASGALRARVGVR